MNMNDDEESKFLRHIDEERKRIGGETLMLRMNGGGTNYLVRAVMVETFWFRATKMNMIRAVYQHF
jgi:hypothetical protein